MDIENEENNKIIKKWELLFNLHKIEILLRKNKMFLPSKIVLNVNNQPFSIFIAGNEKFPYFNVSDVCKLCGFKELFVSATSYKSIFHLYDVMKMTNTFDSAFKHIKIGQYINLQGLINLLSSKKQNEGIKVLLAHPLVKYCKINLNNKHNYNYSYIVDKTI